MMAVTVVASRDVGCDVGFAQRHGLAVVGIPVMKETVLVTLTAPTIADLFEMGGAVKFDFVSGMAIGADRSARVAAQQELTMHASVVNLLDPNMAFSTGVRHVRFMNG